MTTAINTAADLFNVRGMVALITGGGSGLGAYAARALDANGASAVYIVGRRQSKLDEVASTAVNSSIIPLVGDITSKESLAALAAHVREKHGFLNLLFCNAGVIGPRLGDSLKTTGGEGGRPSVKEYQAALLAPEMGEFTQTYHTNVTAVVYTVAAFMDLLDEGNRRGNVAQNSQVLVTSSIAGFSRQVAAGIAYSTSKAGTTHAVKNLATAFAQNKFNIRVNGLAPGLYPSEMTTDQTSKLNAHGGVAGHDKAFAGAHEMPTEACPAGRTGSEQDFAGTILFMVSQAGSYMNGEVLVTDGGRLSQLPSVY